MIRFFLIALVLGLSSFQWAIGQLELPEDKVKMSATVEQKGCEATILVKVNIVPKWHINACKLPEGSFLFPTSITFRKGEEFLLQGKLIEPKPHYMRDELADEDLFYHEGTVVFKQKVKVISEKDFTLKGEFEYQTCNDVKCLPNSTYPIAVKLKGCPLSQSSAIPAKQADIDPEASQPFVEEKTQTSAQSAQSKEVSAEQADEEVNESPSAVVSKQNKSAEDKKLMNESGWKIFLLAFASGFLALVMPCVFPMIPMTVSFFTKRSKTRTEGIRNAFIYGGSIVLIHVLLGALVVITGAGQLLNELSTNVYFNLFFFLMLIVFGLSFLGAFEIVLPSSWVNKADAKADQGGVIGIFFMALVLSLASFSCTGPILGQLLGGLSAYGGGSALMIGMFAFGLALALPFMLFSIFPSWLNTMPNSGGWLNVVKVFLGFLEIALAFKFLSTADTTMQWHLLEREVFIAIWVAVFGALTMYMFGKIQLPHDGPITRLSVGRTMMATFCLAFTVYLIPGLWGAPLKIVNAFLPPDFYAESPSGLSGAAAPAGGHEGNVPEGMHKGPNGLLAFKDYDKALAYAKEVNKPLFIDFTGWGCVNCRKMEQSVWPKPGIIDHLRNDVVIVSLYVDERTALPKEEQITVEIRPGKTMELKTIGHKWTYKQIKDYQTATQPLYVMQTPEGKDLGNGTADYQNHSDPKVFQQWIEAGLKSFKEK